MKPNHTKKTSMTTPTQVLALVKVDCKKLWSDDCQWPWVAAMKLQNLSLIVSDERTFGLNQFSVEKAKTVRTLMPHVWASLTTSLSDRTPASCPMLAGKPRRSAHLEFPSMMMATCFGSAAASSSSGNCGTSSVSFDICNKKSFTHHVRNTTKLQSVHSCPCSRLYWQTEQMQELISSLSPMCRTHSISDHTQYLSRC